MTPGGRARRFSALFKLLFLFRWWWLWTGRVRGQRESDGPEGELRGEAGATWLLR